ncbi:MAG TPA: DNA-binding domain-containing protein [Gammaproteobacteria bacterium]|jgi:hypothetical protein|nr:DNA-binding domain-containing protein [Gammaproteobacteria bacterium]
MSELQKLQEDFQQFLFTGNNSFPLNVLNTADISAEARLDIYRFAYKSRLIDALASNYPVLSSYLGDEAFQALAIDYISDNPSQNKSVRWFGNQLSDFLQTHAFITQYPFIAELAKFEWIQTLVFDGADAPCLKIKDMELIQPEQWVTMKFRVHPTVHRINLTWNIDEIWQAVNEENKNFPESVQDDTPVPWLCWRRELINRFYSMTEMDAWAIDGVLQNMSFGDICEGLCQWINEDEAGHYAASLLKGWIESGILSHVFINS